FLDVQLLDDPAVEMLHALAIGFDLDKSVRDDRAVQRRRNGPCSKSSEKQSDNRPTRDRNLSQGVAGGRRRAIRGFPRTISLHRLYRGPQRSSVGFLGCGGSRWPWAFGFSGRPRRGLHALIGGR